MTIPIQHLTFHCRWTSEARLPDYLGSTLRGAFGWALKRCACMLKRQKCPTCVLNKSCAYSVLFATELYEGCHPGGTVNARPHPLIFQPNAVVMSKGQAGTTWDFSLVVIGRAKEFLPHIVFSVETMGAAGIGVGAKHGMGRFSLDKVSANNTTIFESSIGLLGGINTDSCLDLEPPQRNPSRICIRLCTPLRLKKENKLQSNLPFHVLIRSALRRISALEIAYSQEGRGEPALDYSGLARRAESIHLKQSNLRWRELKRYSNRQQQKVSLSGLVGSSTYEGELAEFVPILKYISQVHIGKQTLFGLGKIEIECAEKTNLLSEAS